MPPSTTYPHFTQMHSSRHAKIQYQTGCPRSGKKSGEIFFFSRSGNFDISQGILHFQPKVR